MSVDDSFKKLYTRDINLLNERRSIRSIATNVMESSNHLPQDVGAGISSQNRTNVTGTHSNKRTKKRKKSKKKRGGQPGPRKKNNLLAISDRCNSSLHPELKQHVLNHDDNSATGKCYTRLCRLLENVKNWTCSLNFVVSPPNSEHVQSVNLIEKLRTCDYSNDGVFVFPERFQGLNCKDELLSSLKEACQLEGFSIAVASTQYTHQLGENHWLAAKVRLGCKQSRCYRLGKRKEMEPEPKKYATTTQRPQTEENKCPFSFIIACVTSQNHYDLDTKPPNLSQNFITTNSGRWILMPVPFSKCNCNKIMNLK